jgi:hypothetical protein
MPSEVHRCKDSIRRFPGVGHTSAAINNTILTLNSFVTMAPIDEAIAFLKSSTKPNISEAARIFQVERSVLSKRFRSIRASMAKANETK